MAGHLRPCLRQHSLKAACLNDAVAHLQGGLGAPTTGAHTRTGANTGLGGNPTGAGGAGTGTGNTAYNQPQQVFCFLQSCESKR